jgi:WD40 repeat protein
MQTITFIFARATEVVSQQTISNLYSSMKLKLSTKQGTKWKGKVAKVLGCNIVIFDTITQTALKILEHKEKPHYVIQLRNGNIVSSNYDMNIYMWDIETGMIMKTFTGYKGTPYFLLELQNGNLFTESSEGMIKIFDVTNGTCVLTTDNCNQLGTVCQLQDGTIVFSDDELMVIWDMSTGERKYEMKIDQYYYTMTEIEKEVVVCGSHNAVIDIYLIKTEITRIMRIDPPENDFLFTSVLLKNGHFATACYGNIKVWNRNGECLAMKGCDIDIRAGFMNKIAEIEPGVLAFQNANVLICWDIEKNSTKEIEIGRNYLVRCFLFN